MARPLTGTARYTGVAIAFHWTIAALIIVNLFLGYAHLYDEHWGAIPTHKAIGITVLALSVGRLVWRLTHRPPPLPADVTRAQTGAAHALHWTFYLLMIVMPMSGWIMSSISTKYPLSWFGLFPIPYLPVLGNEALGDRAYAAHYWIGWLFLPLIAIHVGAALWHHYGQRDGLLLRMMPGGRRIA